MNLDPCTPPAPDRTPVHIPDDAAIWDAANDARAHGLRLVSDGFDIYVIPIVLPGERVVAEAA